MKLTSLCNIIYLVSSGAKACSDFVLNTTTKAIVSARTMDFTQDLDTVLEIIPQGHLFEELPVHNCPECKDYAWISKYGFVAMNMLGVNVATDGLNEKGLSAAMLYLLESEYPSPLDMVKKNKTTLPLVTSICSYLMGTYASVAEVRTGLATVEIAEIDEKLALIVAPSSQLHRVPLHISVHDALGESLVIEFLHGQMNLYNNVNEVLTNDPPLTDQLDDLKNHGFENLPGGYASVPRFERLSILNRLAYYGYVGEVANSQVPSFTVGSDEQKEISNALHLINTVVVPPMGGGATQWTLLRDHTRLKVYFQSTQNLILKVLDLKQIDFSNPKSRHLISVAAGPWAIDITKELQNPNNNVKTFDLPPRSIVEKAIVSIIHEQRPTLEEKEYSSGDLKAIEGIESPHSIWNITSLWFFLAGICCNCLITIGSLQIYKRVHWNQMYQSVP